MRDVRYPVLCSLPVIIVAYFLPPHIRPQQVSPVAISAAILLFAAGTVLFHFELLVLRRFGLLAVFFATGGLIGFLFLLSQGQIAAVSGMPSERVVEVAGVLREDSTAARGGLSICKLSLRQVFDGNGSAATARGELTIVLNEAGRRFWGEEVKIPVSSFPSRGEPVRPAYQSGQLELIGHANAPVRWRRMLLLSIMDGLVEEMGPAGNFFSAIFWGRKNDPADPLYIAFRQTGSSHILALSGMHLGIISAFFFLVLRPIFGKRAAFIATIPFIAVYITVVGFKPSLLRAAIMYVMWGAQSFRGKKTDPLSSLSVVFLIITLIDPSAVSSLSFKLSFLALLGILTFGKIVIGWSRARVPKVAAVSLGLSVGAQIATIPVVGLEFGMFYPIGIIVAILVSPVVTGYLWTGCIFLLVSLLRGKILPLDALHEVLLFALLKIQELIYWIIRLFTGVPGVSLSGPVVLMTGIMLPSVFLIMRFRKAVRCNAAD